MARKAFARSLPFGMIITISLMGLLGLTLALLTGEYYKRLVSENDQQTYAELLEREVTAALRAHRDLQLRLAQHLQKQPDFQQAAQTKDAHRLQYLLDQQFQQYLVSSGQLVLLQLKIYQPDFSLLADSSGQTGMYAGRPACQDLVAQAQGRQGIERLKWLSGACTHDRRPLHSTIIPMGGIRPYGYLMIIATPTPQLLALAEKLQGSVDVVLSSGLRASHSGGDHSITTTDRVSDVAVRIPSGDLAYTVRLHRDALQLIDRLRNARLLLTTGALLLIGLAMAIVYLVMQRTLLRPLSQLTQQVARITDDRAHLSEPLPVRGGAEVQQLAAGFNTMSAELARLYGKLEQMAFSDALTNLPNRAWFHDSLQRLVSLAERGQPGFALLFVDLDKFKAINDSYGHQAGDETLKRISARIVAVLRGGDYLAHFRHETSDALARMGGDEFAVLLPSLQTRAAAERVAQKIITAVEKPFKVGDVTLQLGASIGIALFPEDATDVQTLIHHADLAMYHAKSHGGGFTSYRPGLEDAANSD